MYFSNLIIFFRYFYNIFLKAKDKKIKLFEIYIFFQKATHIIKIKITYYNILIYYKVKYLYKK